MTRPDPVRWQEGYEHEAAAEQAYIEYEMFTRGDGCWMPWSDISGNNRSKWYRIADAVLRGINHHRYHLEDRDAAPYSDDHLTD